MTAMPTFPSGHQPAPGELQALLPMLARKTIDETVTSSTTLQNDDALFLTGFDPAGVYRIRACVLFRAAASGATPGMKTNFSGMTNADASNFTFSLSGASSGVAANGAISGINCATTNSYLFVWGLLVPIGGAMSGTLQFTWAQNTSSGSGTTVAAGSFLEAERMA